MDIEYCTVHKSTDKSYFELFGISKALREKSRAVHLKGNPKLSKYIMQYLSKNFSNLNDDHVNRLYQRLVRMRRTTYGSRPMDGIQI